MGFVEVHDYEGGKRDWGSSGLPREGRIADEPSAGELARHDVPTCALDDDLAAVRARVRESGGDTCIVVNESGVVLGRLGRRQFRGDGDVTVEEGVTEGPSTIR